MYYICNIVEYKLSFIYFVEEDAYIDISRYFTEVVFFIRYLFNLKIHTHQHEGSFIIVTSQMKYHFRLFLIDFSSTII